MKAQVILWDWKEEAPINAIVNAVKRIKSAKLWNVDDGSDTNVLVVAKDKAAARRAYNKWNQSDDPEWKPEIRLWEDES